MPNGQHSGRGSIAQATTLKNYLNNGFYAAFKVNPSQFLHAQDVPDLLLGVGIVLGRAPEQKKEVARVHVIHLARIHPATNHRTFFIGQHPGRLVFCLRQHVGTTHDFLGEYLGGRWMLPGIINFGTNVVADGFLRLTLRYYLLQSLDPFVVQFHDDAPIYLLLGRKVVVEVWPRQLSCLGDVIHARTVKSAHRQQFLRRKEYLCLFLITFFQFFLLFFGLLECIRVPAGRLRNPETRGLCSILVVTRFGYLGRRQ